MKQAHADYKMRVEAWQANIDTLQRRYAASIETFKQNSKKLSKKERDEQIASLQRMEADIKKYSTAVKDEAKKQEQESTEAVLSQVNSFVKEYAKKRGYDMVLGAEGNGSVLFGEKKMDITDDVLKELNGQVKMLPGTDKPKE